jgi:hypothetical protein
MNYPLSKEAVPDFSCTGYLGYPFSNQEINSHGGDLLPTSLMFESQGK